MIIASSSSGLTMSEIQSGAASHPERCVIAHPFNPPHLIPLVEIVGGAKTSERRTSGPPPATKKRSAVFLEHLAPAPGCPPRSIRNLDSGLVPRCS